MKTVKLLFIQLLFFILMSIVTQLLNKQYFFKQICHLVLIVGITYYIYAYFIKINNMLKGYLINLFSLILLFELKKFIEYSFGLISPKYSEVIFISMLLSFVCIVIYLAGIVFVVYLKKIRKK
jgi:hypothetical protein